MTKFTKKVPQGHFYHVFLGPDGKPLVKKIAVYKFSDDSGYDERGYNADERKPGSTQW